MAFPRLFLTQLALAAVAAVPAIGQGWSEYGHDPQHTTVATVVTQIPQQVRWSTPVDMAPQYSGTDLLIHYASPVITAANTVIVPVKTQAAGGFQIEAHSAANQGALLWTLVTDFVVPHHGWFPICGATLTPGDATVVVPAAGGTILVRATPDSTTGETTRLAFYGIDNYHAAPDAYQTAIQICTPISRDAAGNLYFGYVSNGVALPGYPAGIPSGLARISTTGDGRFASAAAISGDATMVKVCYNCAPAFSADGTTLYVAVNNTPVTEAGYFARGYLCAVDSTTLASKGAVFLNDPRYPSGSHPTAILTDDSSASPTVGPDGDVYFGVLEADFPSNNDRGWLLHFSGDLQTTKLAGAFGWDDTASIVPVAAVPGYSGTSPYLVLTKYNNYAGINTGDGENRLAILDPNAAAIDPVTGVMVMNPVVTVKGGSPDPDWVDIFPDAVREWCINSAVVDPVSHCAVVNNEDGHVYRWDLTKATDEPGQLSLALYLAPATGEAYTPTVVGPDGAVYAINNATLFSAVAIPALQAQVDAQNELLTFSYLRAQTGSTYFVETTTDLIHWTTDGVNQGGGDIGQVVSGFVSIDMDTKRFVRLVVTTP